MIKKTEKAEKYSAPALSKGLDILELLAGQSTGMKKSDIAKMLGKSVNEIFRMLVVLTDRGYVLVDEASEQYSISLKLFELAHRNPPIKRLTNVASEIMSEIAVRLNQSIHLAILDGSNILVIAQNDPPGNNITSVRLGARIPLALTASGVILVGDLEKSKILDIFDQAKDVTPDQLESFLENSETVAKAGFCVSPSMVIEGVQNVSTPITDYSGHIVASLTIPYIHRLISKDDPDLDTVLEVMIEASHKISGLLGANIVENKSTD